MGTRLRYDAMHFLCSGHAMCIPHILAVARPLYEAHLHTKGIQDHSCHKEAHLEPPGTDKRPLASNGRVRKDLLPFCFRFGRVLGSPSVSNKFPPLGVQFGPPPLPAVTTQPCHVRNWPLSSRRLPPDLQVSRHAQPSTAQDP